MAARETRRRANRDRLPEGVPYRKWIQEKTAFENAVIKAAINNGLSYREMGEMTGLRKLSAKIIRQRVYKMRKKGQQIDTGKIRPRTGARRFQEIRDTNHMAFRVLMVFPGRGLRRLKKIPKNLLEGPRSIKSFAARHGKKFSAEQARGIMNHIEVLHRIAAGETRPQAISIKTGIALEEAMPVCEQAKKLFKALGKEKGLKAIKLALDGKNYIEIIADTLGIGAENASLARNWIAKRLGEYGDAVKKGDTARAATIRGQTSERFSVSPQDVEFAAKKFGYV